MYQKKSYKFKRVAPEKKGVYIISKSTLDYESLSFEEKSERMKDLDKICNKFFEDNKEKIEKAGFDPNSIKITIN